MNIHTLTPDETDQVCTLLGDLATRIESVEDPGFLEEAGLLCHELPVDLRRFLHRFKATDAPGAACIVRGYPIGDEKIGRTPVHWNARAPRSAALEEEIYLMLIGTLLGEPFAWRTQQAGHMVHDVVPIAGHEHEQLGSSSTAVLTWHTEDAFHPYSADYLALMCLRNPDRVATVLASADAVRLPDAQIKLLFEPHFTIRPDESHLQKNAATPPVGDPALASAYARIQRMNEQPEKIAVLYGDPAAPYMRVDPYFMDPVEDPAAAAALEALVERLDEALHEVVLQPGDAFVIDNARAVHGRRSFAARYDGHDRWLKRINIARDLRKSRAGRASVESRIVI